MTQLPISIPSGFTPLVKKDESVSVGTVLAQKSATPEHIVNISEVFAVSPSEARKTLLKSPGDPVSTGDILAVRKRLFGRKKEITSNIDGKVLRFERDTGILVIQANEEQVNATIISPVEGTVSLCDNGKIVIATGTKGVIGKRGVGSVGTGEILIVNDPFVQQVTDFENESLLYLVGSDAIGKVLLGGYLPREVLLKGIGLGVNGIIVTQLADDDIEYLQKRNHRTPVIEVDLEIAKKLAGQKGKKVYLDAPLRTILFLNE